MLGIPCGPDNLISIVFIVADESINAAMIYFEIASSRTLIDASGVWIDASLSLFWCL